MKPLNFREILMFVFFWIIGLFIWAIWLNGIYVPILGFITAIIFRLFISFIRIIDEKY